MMRPFFSRVLLTGTCVVAIGFANGLFEIDTHSLNVGVHVAAAQGGGGSGGGGGGPGGGSGGGPGGGSGAGSGGGPGSGTGMGGGPGSGMGAGPGHGTSAGMQQGSMPRGGMMQGQGPQSQMMSRDQIRDVQRHLNGMGYRAGPADGMMGPQTRAAISAYQSRMGMTPNGMLTPDLADRIGKGPMGQRAN